MRSGRYQWLEVDSWFRPVSARPLAALRVALPLLLLLHLVALSNDGLALHGDRGIIPWELTDLLRDPWVPGLPTLAKAFRPLGIGLHTAIVLLLSGYAGSLLSLALGFYPRLSAFLAWGLHLSLVTSGAASFYGVDQLANTFLLRIGRTSGPLVAAAALVVETGGPLDHVAAQARERGIPAVVGAAGACAAFADGDQVIVDGGAGLVARID